MGSGCLAHQLQTSPMTEQWKAKENHIYASYLTPFIETIKSYFPFTMYHLLRGCVLFWHPHSAPNIVVNVLLQLAHFIYHKPAHRNFACCFCPSYSLELRLKWYPVKDGASAAALCAAACQDDCWSIAGMRWSLWKVSGAEDHDIFLFSFEYVLHVFTIFCFREAPLKKNCIILDTESIFINSAVDNFIPYIMHSGYSQPCPPLVPSHPVMHTPFPRGPFLEPFCFVFVPH